MKFLDLSVRIVILFLLSKQASSNSEQKDKAQLNSPTIDHISTNEIKRDYLLFRCERYIRLQRMKNSPVKMDNRPLGMDNNNIRIEDLFKTSRRHTNALNRAKRAQNEEARHNIDEPREIKEDKLKEYLRHSNELNRDRRAQNEEARHTDDPREINVKIIKELYRHINGKKGMKKAQNEEARHTDDPRELSEDQIDKFFRRMKGYDGIRKALYEEACNTDDLKESNVNIIEELLPRLMKGYKGMEGSQDDEVCRNTNEFYEMQRDLIQDFKSQYLKNDGLLLTDEEAITIIIDKDEDEEQGYQKQKNSVQGHCSYASKTEAFCSKFEDSSSE